MDTLALLCNLHADGPETLQLLRRAGWDTLEDVEKLDPPELAQVLSISEERAARFQREAQHLRARLEGPERAPGSGAAARDASGQRPRKASPRASPPARAAEPLNGSVERNGAHGSNGSHAHNGVEEHGLVDDGVEELELELPARDLIPHPSVPPAALPHAPAARSPRPPIAARRSDLAPNAIDGLDAPVCAALVDAGIQSLAELGNALPLELASATGLDYTRLLRLQFLARRRALAAGPTRTPSEPTRPAPLDEIEPDDVAGPFV